MDPSDRFVGFVFELFDFVVVGFVLGFDVEFWRQRQDLLFDFVAEDASSFGVNKIAQEIAGYENGRFDGVD